MEFGRIICDTPSRLGEDGGSHKGSYLLKKRLYIQILLAVELLLRLDAVIKGDIARTSGERTNVTARDIHHFNHLRSRKIDFDLVLARRFLDYFRVESNPIVRPKRASEGVYGQWNESPSSNGDAAHLSTSGTSKDLILIPRRGAMQLEGLIRFARGINWPNSDELERTLAQKVTQDPMLVAADALNSAEYGPEGLPSKSPSSAHAHSSISKPGSIFRRLSSSEKHKIDTSGDSQVRDIILHQATATNTGSWLSRSWLAGLVLPGTAISHHLMSAVLENDPGHALNKLGDQTNLCGGLVLDGQSWWSKSSIVSRVLGSLNGAAECMGWVSLPKVHPVLDDGKELPNAWIEVSSEKASPSFDTPRLFDGPKVAQESSPLGVGQGKVMSTEFNVPPLMPYDSTDDGDIHFLALRLRGLSSSRSMPCSATTEFLLREGGGHGSSGRKRSFHLRYDVHFISGQPCRLPIAQRVFRIRDERSTHLQLGPLTAHPLHESYRYKTVTLNDLLLLRSENMADAMLK